VNLKVHPEDLPEAINSFLGTNSSLQGTGSLLPLREREHLRRIVLGFETQRAQLLARGGSSEVLLDLDAKITACKTRGRVMDFVYRLWERGGIVRP
jgi:hypothetical protein